MGNSRGLFSQESTRWRGKLRCSGRNKRACAANSSVLANGGELPPRNSGIWPTETSWLQKLVNFGQRRRGGFEDARILANGGELAPTNLVFWPTEARWVQEFATSGQRSTWRTSLAELMRAEARSATSTRCDDLDASSTQHVGILGVRIIEAHTLERRVRLELGEACDGAPQRERSKLGELGER